MELVAALDRMRVTQEVSTRTIIQNQGRMRKEMAHLTPTKLAELINLQQKRKEQDSTRYRSGLKQFFRYLLAVVVSVSGTVIAYKLTGH
jgi:hypothetical protein